jgi:DNA-binding phage protein
MIKMKNKLLLYAIFPVIGLGLLGYGAASAHGLFGGFGGVSNMTPEQIVTRQQTMFQNEANMLGISVDDVKNGWAEGKSLLQIATDHGITREQLQQKMKDAQTAQLKSQLDILVANGTITQVQADKRMAFMSAQVANGNLHKGIGRGMMRGIR